MTTMTIRETLLAELKGLERQSSGEGVRKAKPAIIIKAKLPIVSNEEWVRLDRAARNPSIKRRRQVIISTT